MNFSWTQRLAGRISDYRPDWLPVPTNPDMTATVKRRRNRMIGNAAIYGVLLLVTRIAWMVWG